MATLALAVADRLEEIDLDRVAREGARDAALAFRVMREARVIGPTATTQFTARIAPAVWVEYSHPGPWSVSLEPRATLYSDEHQLERLGRLVRPLEAAPFAELLNRRGDIQAIAVARTPGLAAVAKAGLVLSVATSAGEAVELPLIDADHIADALAERSSGDRLVQAVLLSDGRLVALSAVGVLAAAERVIALEEAAQIHIHAAVLRREAAL
ncbi:hypothetical protein [Phenylobacterium immobile]|uniref:hypothetical protein n=1 Tax=Phenylobacterium immobile TaxID=21 RepID=UPI000A567D3E|nr:hypothetical protein [Phenylobacterium immobile]